MNEWLYKLYTLRLYIIGLACILIVGIYVGLLLFGNNSIEVLLMRNETATKLENDIKKLKNENVSMQKQIFELRSLEPKE